MISILLGSGFEEVEAITVFDILKRAGADVLLVSVTGTPESKQCQKSSSKS
jgi:protein deglycase